MATSAPGPRPLSTNLMAPSCRASTGLMPSAPPTSATALQPTALLQMLEAVHHGNDAHPLLELFQHSGDLLRRQALLITQAHRLTDEQRLSL